MGMPMIRLAAVISNAVCRAEEIMKEIDRKFPAR